MLHQGKVLKTHNSSLVKMENASKSVVHEDSKINKPLNVHSVLMDVNNVIISTSVTNVWTVINLKEQHARNVKKAV